MTLPARVGKYRIDGLLGRGAVGVVYKAFQEDLGRHVALKVLIAGQHGSPELIKRFLREARAAASLSDSGIVQVFDVGADKDVNFIVMEYVDGKSLADVLKVRRLKAEEALQIAFQVARALQAAHERGIVHRDIKPSNILLDVRGQPKIADFGLATALEEQERLTATGDILGTAWYMSPEQAFGSPEEIDARADVYSLGAVLYEMLVGRPPFDGARATAVLKKIETEEVIRPSSANPALDPRLDDLVLKALEKDPGRRYPTAGEFSTAIRESIEGRIPAGAGRRPAWWKPALAAAAAALIVAAGAAAFRSPSEKTPTRSDALAGIREALDLPGTDPLRKRRLSDAVESLERAGSGGGYALRSRAYLDLGSVRRALEAASTAIEKGEDSAALRAHRIYLTFLRHLMTQKAARLTYLHPHSTMGLEQEMDVLRARNASAEELLIAELALLCFRGSYREVATRTSGKDSGPIAVMRWTALVHDALDAEDEAQKPAAKLAEEELRAALAREPGHPQAQFLRALLTAGGGNRRNDLRREGDFLDDGPVRWADPFLLRAIILDRQDRSELLLENLRIARRIDPEDPLIACYELATLLSTTEDARRDPPAFAKLAREALVPEVARNPSFPAPYVLLAAAQLIEGKAQEAEDLLSRARLKFGSPDSWGSSKEWGRATVLEELARHAGEKGPRYQFAVARFLSYFRLSSAEAAWRTVQEMISAPDAAQRYSMDAKSIRDLKVSLHGDLAAVHASRGKLEEVVTHLRECIRFGGDLEDILEDSRFESVRENSRVKELRTKRE